MNDADLTLQTGIFLSAAKHAQLMKEVIDAPPNKGMSVTIEELKELQKSILKDVKMLNRHILKEEFLTENKRIFSRGGGIRI